MVYYSPRKTRDLYWCRETVLHWPATRHSVLQMAAVKFSWPPQHLPGHHCTAAPLGKTPVETGSPWTVKTKPVGQSARARTRLLFIHSELISEQTSSWREGTGIQKEISGILSEGNETRRDKKEPLHIDQIALWVDARGRRLGIIGGFPPRFRLLLRRLNKTWVMSVHSHSVFSVSNNLSKILSLWNA